MSHQSHAAVLVATFLAAHPASSHLSQARMLYKAHAKHWPTFDACHQMVRYYRGRHGQAGRPAGSAKSTADLWQTAAQCEAREQNPFGMPASDAVPWLPYELKGERILVLGDIHVPYHDPKALGPAVEWGRKSKPDTILLLGDFLDCHRLSRFQPDAGSRRFVDEVKAARQMIDSLRDYFDGARILYKMGNHDERYENYLQAKAPELEGLGEGSFKHLFRKQHVTLIDRKRLVTAGKLTLIHGHEYRGGITSPVNPARGLFLRAKSCALCAHQHQSSSHDEPTIRGTQIGTWSVGCLCDLHPQYAPLNRWCHGAAFITVNHRTGWFEVDNRKIIEGRVV